jgi:STE24 endopeptidase
VSVARAIAIVVLAGLVAAAVLAVVSRAPAEVREARPSPDAADPARGATFTEEDIARHDAYRGPSYLSFGLSSAVGIVVLVVLAVALFPALYDATRGLPGGWPVQALVLAALAVVILWAARLPLSYVRGFEMQHAWGLSTQDFGGWLSDRLKSVGVSAVITGIAAIAFFSVVRWQPRAWWLVGWAAFTMLTALLTFVYPVVIAPLFHNFTPLQDPELRARVVALAEDAGVEVEAVLVADASRRTTAENAYVAGLGATKRVVLYDTLLEGGTDEDVAFVVAHELGHQVERHVLKNVVLASAGLFVGFALLAWLAGKPQVWSWAGAGGISDLRAIPVLLLFSAALGLVTMPLQSAVSRSFEARADEIAIELTGDPEPAVKAFRRLAFANLADLSPPAVAVWTLYSHPPIPDRIESVLKQAEKAD